MCTQVDEKCLSTGRSRKEIVKCTDLRKTERIEHELQKLLFNSPFSPLLFFSLEYVTFEAFEQFCLGGKMNERR